MNERHDEIDDAVAVEVRLYLLTANAACWKCGRPQDVVAIAAQGLSEGGEPIPDTQDPKSLVVLSAIVEMPSELLAFMQQRQPRYQKQYSRTAEMSYYANTWQCGALFGVDESTRVRQNRAAILDDAHASVRSEAEDSRRSREQSHPLRHSSFCGTSSEGHGGQKNPVKSVISGRILQTLRPSPGFGPAK